MNRRMPTLIILCSCLCASNAAVAAFQYAAPQGPRMSESATVVTHGHNPLAPRRGPGTGGYRSTPILHVDQSAAPGGNGSSWELAYQDLQQALADAQADPTVIEIRVAEGTYLPDAGTGDRGAEFLLLGQSDLVLTGGFPAGGSDPEGRDPDVYLTILSGDLAADDVVTFEHMQFDENMYPINNATAGVHFDNIVDNSRTVVGASGADSTVVIDGFIIEGGHDLERGGGLTAAYAALQLRNVMFRNNSANTEGGAIFLANMSGPVLLEGCTFQNNASGSTGGAIHVQNGPTQFTNCSFSENSSHEGGGVFLAELPETSPYEFIDSSFVRNVARQSGGGLSGIARLRACQFEANAASASGGAALLDPDSIAEDSTARENRAGNGGAFWFAFDGTVSSCVFELNAVGNDGGAIWSDRNVTVSDSRFAENSARRHGGAVLLDDNLTVSNCRFEANHAGGNGGAVWVYDDCVITQSLFDGNHADMSGGAVGGGSSINTSVFRSNFAGLEAGACFVDNGSAVRRCAFVTNGTAGDGGALLLHVAATVETCLFVGNFAAGAGGAISGDGANCSLTNVTMVANEASQVGGVFCSVPLVVTNAVLWNNSDDVSGTERAQVGGAFHSISHSLIMGLSDYFGAGNLGLDPQFVDAVGADGLAGTGDEDLRLASTSPAIDAGSQAYFYSSTGPFDLDGRPRFVGFGGSLVAIVDLGAYEAQDCDSDGLIDSESIGLGYADDCNSDGIPDSCQAGSLITPTEQKLNPADASLLRNFGRSLDVDAGFIVVSALNLNDPQPSSGVVCVFDSQTGEQIHRLAASDGLAEDFLGESLSLSGGVILAGASGDDDFGSRAGSAYLFDASTGAQLRKLIPADGAAGDRFGSSVSIHDSVAAVGAVLDSDAGIASGSAYLFNVATGFQLGKLLALDRSSSDNFGFSIATDGQRVVVGAIGDDDRGTDAGSAYVFDVATGQQLHKLLPDTVESQALFGSSVSIRDGLIAIGAPKFDHDIPTGVTDSGAVYLFDAVSGSRLARIEPPDPGRNDEFGASVDIRNGLIAVGSEADDIPTSNAGSVYLYDASSRRLLIKLTASGGAASDNFGGPVALSSGLLVAGMDGDDDFGISTGSAIVFRPGVGDENGDGVPDTCICPADLNSDGLMNFFDVQLFLNYYSSADLRADFTNDGELDFFDVLTFLDIVSSGCA